MPEWKNVYSIITVDPEMNSLFEKAVYREKRRISHFLACQRFSGGPCPDPDFHVPEGIAPDAVASMNREGAE